MDKLADRISAPAHAFVEEGEAFRALAGLDGRAATSAPHSSRKTPLAQAERYDVIVIGGGQAGLSVGYHLARRGVSFLILDACERIGDVWRSRWDSLHLFTPARFDSLDGMRFPGPGGAFPTKDQMANYLEAYAAHFKLPIRNGVKVERVSKRDGRYLLSCGALQFEADQVVVAMASYQQPKLPAFASELASDIVQLHSSQYRSPQQLREGPVLLVGAGNSGAEIALELVRDHQTWLSGRATGHVPFSPGSLVGRLGFGWFLLRVVFHRILTVRNPLVRRLRAKAVAKGGPLIRIRPGQLERAGVKRAARVIGARAGLPSLDDGRTLEVKNVIWCNGFSDALSFIDLPIFEDGKLRHVSGEVASQPGLYFVGLHFLHAFSSTMIHGVGRDAARIAQRVAERAHVGGAWS